MSLVAVSGVNKSYQVGTQTLHVLRDVAFAVYFTLAFGIGAFWALVIGQLAGNVGYPVAFTVMAASYVGAAVLLLAIRDRPVDPMGD
mgnify:CR=1 FL=1